MILAAPLKKLRHFESELDIREIVCEKHAFQKVQITNNKYFAKHDARSNKTYTKYGARKLNS